MSIGPVPCNVSQMHFSAVNWLCENIHLKKIVCLIHACHPQLALSNVELNGMSMGFANVLDIWWIPLDGSDADSKSNIHICMVHSAIAIASIHR